MSDNMLMESLKVAVERVFDTSKKPWERKDCGRQRCLELILTCENLRRLQAPKYFGDKERKEIPDRAIPHIQALYNEYF